MLKEIIEDINERKIEEGSKIKLLDDITYAEIDAWQNNDDKPNTTPYIEKGATLVYEDGVWVDEDSGSSVSMEMLSDYNIHHKNIK